MQFALGGLLKQKRPNKPEEKILSIVNEVCPGEYKYTGDGKFAIYGLYPDFTNCNGQKKIIEHFGDYWHREQDPQDRINKFKEFGYDCLIIWEHELRDAVAVTAKIREFTAK